MFILYIKSKIKSIFMFLILSLIFAAVFYLYNLNVEAVLYASLLSLVPIIIFSTFDFIRFLNKVKTLSHILESANVTIDDLPKSQDITEKSYQDIIRTLYQNNLNLISRTDTEKSDLLDYYTLWAHQIKTPISATRLLLQSKKTTNSEISIELFKIEQYVEMVLQYLRVKNINSDFVFKNYDLDMIIKQAIRKYSKIFIGKKISLEYSDVNCNVLTDEKWITFVIEQILSNALKYTNQGKISIYMESENSKILIIEDTGIGIAAEDLPRIFEKGFTGYNGRLNKKSTGIGLYLCKTILNKLSHKINIESDLGEGVTVKIDFTTNNLKVE